MVLFRPERFDSQKPLVTSLNRSDEQANAYPAFAGARLPFAWIALFGLILVIAVTLFLISHFS